MVPHRNILRLIALTSLLRTDKQAYVRKKCHDLRVAFPYDVTAFIMDHVYPDIGVSCQAYLVTTNPSTQKDFSVLFQAAAKLGVERFIKITANGPDVDLPEDIVLWREEDQMRIFVETSFLCGISRVQVEEDIRRVWGIDFDSDQLDAYRFLFADPTFIRGDHWVAYERCITGEEAIFKKRLLNAPHDYVRHTLGVPVTLETSKIIDRLISDAYYTERSLKDSVSNPDLMNSEMLKRIKMERDTIFKAMDRRIKIQQYEHEKGSTGGSDIVRETLERLQVQYNNSSDVNREARLLSELNGEDDVSDNS